MRVAVIGAGPAGLTAACHLARGGAAVEVFEADRAVGGLARSIDLWGRTVDLGPHAFAPRDPRVDRLWQEALGDDGVPADPGWAICTRNRLLTSPPSLAETLCNLGLVETARCALSYVCRPRRAGPKTPAATQGESLQAWAVRRFGRRATARFLAPYAQKLWGLPGDQLDARCAAGADRPGGARPLARPRGGNGAAFERMAGWLRQAGGRIHFNQPVERVVCREREVCGVELPGDRLLRFDHVVSTMPLTTLVRGLPDLPAEVLAAADALAYRNTVLVYLHLDRAELFAAPWAYLPDRELMAGRATHFPSGTPAGQRTSILALEYACADGQSLWSESSASLISRAVREARWAGLAADASVLDGQVVRLRWSHPVCRLGYRRHVGRIAAHLAQFRGLTTIGRYGSFQPATQDQSMHMGLAAAEAILKDRPAPDRDTPAEPLELHAPTV